MGTNKNSTKGFFVIVIIVFAIAYFRGCREKEQEALRQRLAEQEALRQRLAEQEDSQQRLNQWLKEEGERRRRESTENYLKKEREKRSAFLRKQIEEQERRRQIWEDERIRQRAREGKGYYID